MLRSRSSFHPDAIRGMGALAAATVLLVMASVQPAFAAEPVLNHPAPAFARPDLSGGIVRLDSYRGKVVLLNFWATWCAPCRLEMPRFVLWQKEYAAQGLQVVGVSIDDDQPPVRAFARKLQLNYPVVMGDARLGEAYGGVLGVPVTFLIDRRGIIRARFDGGTDLVSLETRLRRLLAAPR